MRKIGGYLFVFFFLVAILSFSHTAFAVFPQSLLSERVIVRFHDATTEKAKQDVLNQFAINKKETLRLRNTMALSIPRGAGTELIKQLSKFSTVQYAEMDQVAQAFDIPNDPSYSLEWGLQKIQAPSAWDMTHGSSQSAIAIVDTGIDAGHPDLAGHISARANFTTDPDIDNNGHGSHVAGIAGAVTNNGVGVAGVSYSSNLLSVKVLDSTGSGYYSWIANGIVWAADNGAKVINLSLGGSASSTTLKNAVDYAVGKGVIVVAAAGNNYSSMPIYPANYANVISVAATDSSDKKASFSEYGTWVTLAAPGVSIYSTYKGNYAYLSGTSMATPFVSGLAGLVTGLHSDWSANQVINKVETSADAIPGTGTYWKYGRINACKAVDCTPLTPTPTSIPTPSPTLVPTVTPTPTIPVTPVPTVVPTATPSPTSVPTPTIAVTPTPTPTTKPWWCIYVPLSAYCK